MSVLDRGVVDGKEEVTGVNALLVTPVILPLVEDKSVFCASGYTDDVYTDAYVDDILLLNTALIPPYPPPPLLMPPLPPLPPPEPVPWVVPGVGLAGTGDSIEAAVVSKACVALVVCEVFLLVCVVEEEEGSVGEVLLVGFVGSTAAVVEVTVGSVLMALDRILSLAYISLYTYRRI